MAYKQQPKSPLMKALIGKQGNLNAGLRAAIEAAPESPAKMKDLSGDGKVTKKDVLIGRGVLDKDGSPAKKSGPGDKKKNIQKGTINAARQMLKDSTSINNPNLSDAEVIRAAKAKGIYQEASSKAKRAAGKGAKNYDY